MGLNKMEVISIQLLGILACERRRISDCRLRQREKRQPEIRLRSQTPQHSSSARPLKHVFALKQIVVK